MTTGLSVSILAALYRSFFLSPFGLNPLRRSEQKCVFGCLDKVLRADKHRPVGRLKDLLFFLVDNHFAANLDQPAAAPRGYAQDEVPLEVSVQWRSTSSYSSWVFCSFIFFPSRAAVADGFVVVVFRLLRFVHVSLNECRRYLRGRWRCRRRTCVPLGREPYQPAAKCRV